MLHIDHNEKDLLTAVGLTPDKYEEKLNQAYQLKNDQLSKLHIYCILVNESVHGAESTIYLPLSVIYGIDTMEFKEALELTLSQQIEAIINYSSEECITLIHNRFIVNTNEKIARENYNESN
jgi:hypothetical protein